MTLLSIPATAGRRTRSTSARSRAWDACRTSRPSWTRTRRSRPAKLYQDKTAVTAADLLNDCVVPFFDDHGIRLLRVLTDRGTEFCGIADAHPYELYSRNRRHRAYEDEGAATATNGICERFHKTVLDEFYRIKISQEALHESRRTSGRPRRVDRPVQRGKNAPGSVVFRKNAAENFPRQPGSGKRENGRICGLNRRRNPAKTVSIHRTPSGWRSLRLSDQVSTSTLPRRPDRRRCHLRSRPPRRPQDRPRRSVPTKAEGGDDDDRLNANTSARTLLEIRPGPVVDNQNRKRRRFAPTAMRANHLNQTPRETSLRSDRDAPKRVIAMAGMRNMCDDNARFAGVGRLHPSPRA